MVLSSHSLASERMRWAERYRGPVPREWRLCRFCHEFVEDAVHAMFVCVHPELMVTRNVFLEKLYKECPDLEGQYSDAGLFFRDLIPLRRITPLLGKLAFDVLEIYEKVPILVIDPALYDDA